MSKNVAGFLKGLHWSKIEMPQFKFMFLEPLFVGKIQVFTKYADTHWKYIYMKRVLTCVEFENEHDLQNEQASENAYYL